MLFFVFLLFLQQTFSDFTSNEIKGDKRPSIYWNIPTFQCDYHKLNFSKLAVKYNIIQNENDRFRGGKIVILYDPGSFPAILTDETHTVLRNGGVPQEGNLTLHLNLFKTTLITLTPENFSGLGIIDFESWRPIYRQNFGSLTPYKDLSMDIESHLHPFWPKFLVEKEAMRRFEFFARQFMEESLYVAKQLRPNATWGYYAYPYCFNMSPNNMRSQCPNEVKKENDLIDWLFELSDNFYPSLYLSGLRLTSKQNIEMIKGRIEESQRIAGKKHKKLPYFWYKYQDNRKFVTKQDLFNAFLYLFNSNIDGLIIWGSSNDVNTKHKCLELYDYINNVLGPAINEVSDNFQTFK